MGEVPLLLLLDLSKGNTLAIGLLDVDDEVPVGLSIDVCNVEEVDC